MSFHLQIKLIPSCCAASVDWGMVWETSPASSRKFGIEAQQSLGEEGCWMSFILLSAQGSVCSVLSTLRDEKPTGSQEGSQPGLHSLACGQPSSPQAQCCIFVRGTNLCWDAETLRWHYKDTSSDRIQVILAVTRFLGEKRGMERNLMWFLAIHTCALEHLH